MRPLSFSRSRLSTSFGDFVPAVQKMFPVSMSSPPLRRTPPLVASMTLELSLICIPRLLSVRYVCSERYLESPGTKAYTVREAREMFSRFKSADVRIVLTHGDLLESAAGQRHKGVLLSAARRIWPRNLLRKWAKGHGLFMMIQAIK